MNHQPSPRGSNWVQLGPSLWDLAQPCHGEGCRWPPFPWILACSRALWSQDALPAPSILLLLDVCPGLCGPLLAPLPAGARLLPRFLWHPVRAVPGGSGWGVLRPRTVPGQASGQRGVPLPRGLPRNSL